jgi:hypothetical protein
MPHLPRNVLTVRYSWNALGRNTREHVIPTLWPIGGSKIHAPKEPWIHKSVRSSSHRTPLKMPRIVKQMSWLKCLAGLGGSKLPSFFPSTRAESPPAGRWHHAPQHGRGHSRRWSFHLGMTCQYLAKDLTKLSSDPGGGGWGVGGMLVSSSQMGAHFSSEVVVGGDIGWAATKEVLHTADRYILILYKCTETYPIHLLRIMSYLFTHSYSIYLPESS